MKATVLFILFMVCLASVFGQNVQQKNSGTTTNINVKFANLFQFPKTCDLPPLPLLTRPALEDLQPLPALLAELIQSGHTTFVKLLTAAGLVPLLKSGDWTAFAPTDGAFDSDASVAELLLPSNFDKLVTIMKYHLINTTVSSALLVKATSLTTYEGEAYRVSSDLFGRITVDSIPVLRKDLRAGNGLVHSISGVLVPPSLRTIHLIPLLLRDGFTRYVAGIFASALNATFSPPNIVTVFAPSQEAWDKLSAAELRRITGDPAVLYQYALHHAVAGWVPSSSFAVGKTFTTLLGTTLTLNIRNLQWRVNDVLIRKFDVYAYNGIYHEIDTLINPAATQLIPEVVQLTGLSILHSMMVSSGADLDLSSNGPWTFFAANDEALSKVNITDKVKLRLNILYHVVGGIIEFAANGSVTPSYPSQLINHNSAEPLNFTRKADGTVVINGVASIVSKPIRATNGIIYIIDRFLNTSVLEDKPVIQTLSFDDLTITLALWNASGLLDALQANDITLFSPTNLAWQTTLPLGLTLEQLVLPRNIPILRSILLYQISPSRLPTSFLKTGVLSQIPTLLSGESIKLTRLPNNLMFDNASLVTGDIKATNGWIHSINRVIFPLSILPKNTWETLLRNPDFSIFAGLILKANLQNYLIDANNNITLFAPTNAALNTSAVDFSHLVAILQYHMVAGIYYSSSLKPPLSSLLTLQGNSVKVSVTDTFQIKINTATITTVDTLTTNGVIHAINQLLIPISIYPATVVDAAKALGLTVFFDLLDASGLLANLTGSYTLFAPTNDAFAKFDAKLLSDIRNDPVSLWNFVSYYIVTSSVYNTNSFPASLVTVQGESLSFSRSFGVVTVISTNGATRANISNANNFAQNGMLHVLNAVILPYILVPKTVIDLLRANANLTTFYNYLITTGVSDTIFPPTAQPLTFFGPTNDAFTRAQTQYPNYFTKNYLKLILDYHIISGAYTFNFITPGLTIGTIGRGEILQFDVPDNTTKYLFNGSNRSLILTYDAIATSTLNAGVVHTVQDLLIPPNIDKPNL